MTPQDFLPRVFCLIDDQSKALSLTRLRFRRPRRTKRADSQVIAVELAGEFQGIADDQALLR